MWVVSPEARTVEVLYLENGFLRSAQARLRACWNQGNSPASEFRSAEIWPD